MSSTVQLPVFFQMRDLFRRQECFFGVIGEEEEAQVPLRMLDGAVVGVVRHISTHHFLEDRLHSCEVQ
jgi:hypothetical protein